MATGGGRAPEPSTQRSEALSELEGTISLSVKGHESNFDDDAPPSDTNPSGTEYIFDAGDLFNEIDIDENDFVQNVSTIEESSRSASVPMLQNASTFEGSTRSASAPMLIIDESMPTSDLSITSSKLKIKKPIRSILKTKGKFRNKEESLLDLKKKFLCREMELMEEKAAREKEEHELKRKILKAEYDKKKQSENE